MRGLPSVLSGYDGYTCPLATALNEATKYEDTWLVTPKYAENSDRTFVFKYEGFEDVENFINAMDEHRYLTIIRVR
jgi:predicted N-acyltransferase